MQKTLKTSRNNLDLVNKVTAVTGYGINIQASLAFLYTSIKLSEKEINETIPFMVAAERIKYPEYPVTFRCVSWASS